MAWNVAPYKIMLKYALACGATSALAPNIVRIGFIKIFPKIVNDKLKNIGYNKKYTINYGYNYFPKKKYKGITYKEGNYESLVITLGEGKGENFWCVLFPPLCLIEADETNNDNVEYKFFVKELIDKYLKK